MQFSVSLFAMCKWAFGLLFFLWVAVPHLHGQVAHLPDFAKSAHQGMDQLYDMQFGAAEKTFRLLQAKYPDEPAPDFLLALNLWWQIAANTQNKSLDKQLRANLEACIKKADVLLGKHKNESESVFLKMGAWGYTAQIQALRGEFMSAGSSALKFIPDPKMDEKYPLYKYEFLFAEGLYNYYAEWYPEVKPVARPLALFFRKGSKTKGLAQLTEVMTHENYTQVEGAFFLRAIYVESEHTPNLAIPLMAQLVKKYPDNTLFTQLLAITYAKAGRYSEALALAEPLIQTYEAALVSHPAPVALPSSTLTTQVMQGVYLAAGMAESYLATDQQKAVVYLLKADKCCIQNGEPQAEVRAEILLNLGKCYDYQGKRAQALQCYEHVIQLDNHPASTAEAKKLRNSPASRR